MEFSDAERSEDGGCASRRHGGVSIGYDGASRVRVEVALTG